MALTLYNQYDREAVHNIFDPVSTFYSGAGVWGLHGIVPIKNNPGDYVFFVTLGTTQGNHKFIEEIYDDGTFTWQSQPNNTLVHKYVIDFINHDASINTIYLFLRISKADKYTYMGPLEYVSHDNTREKPVFFIWRMLDFDPINAVRALPNLVIKNRKTGGVVKSTQMSATFVTTGTLTLHNAPSRKPINRIGVSTSDFTSKKNVDFQGEAKKNSAIGKAGEDLVVRLEKERLIAGGRSDLASLVVATRDTIGNTAKFDVQSYELNGTDKYIEVKTTTGSASNAIHISEAEVAFSEKHSSEYYLYRLYNYNRSTGDADYYIQKGAIDRTTLVSTNYVF